MLIKTRLSIASTYISTESRQVEIPFEIGPSAEITIDSRTSMFVSYQLPPNNVEKSRQASPQRVLSRKTNSERASGRQRPAKVPRFRNFPKARKR